jgi:hypothetical protein
MISIIEIRKEKKRMFNFYRKEIDAPDSDFNYTIFLLLITKILFSKGRCSFEKWSFILFSTFFWQLQMQKVNICLNRLTIKSKRPNKFNIQE